MIKVKNIFETTRSIGGEIFKALEEKLVPDHFLDAAGNLKHLGLTLVKDVESEVENLVEKIESIPDIIENKVEEIVIETKAEVEEIKTEVVKLKSETEDKFKSLML